MNAFERSLATPETAALFGDASVVQAMLDVEAALSQAEADQGLITPEAAAAIRAKCVAAAVDAGAIVDAGARAGSLAIPLVKQLTAAVARDDTAAAGRVHWGGTSQDVIDSANVLLTRRALALVDAELGRLVDALLAVAERHADAPQLARTLMQPGAVVCFGFKTIAWIQPLQRTRRALAEAGERALQLQLGGAVGTLAALGEHGPGVARRMAALLELPAPQGAWHTQRDDWVRLGCEVGVLCGALGKVARDWALLSQAEIGEIAEPSGEGRGGSSAMPHKRNPVAAMVALSAAQRAPQRVAALLQCMPQEQERGLGNWQAELAEWAGLWGLAHGALRAMAEAAEGLIVDAARMARNIDALHGVVNGEAASLLLGRLIGKPEAQKLMERLSRQALDEGRHLRELLADAVQADDRLAPQIDRARIDALFDLQAASAAARAIAAQTLPRLRVAQRG